MTQREEFENKIKAIDELFGITRNLKHDADTDNYFDAPTNTAYMWFKYGWQAAKATPAVPEGWKLVPVEPNHSMRRAMVQAINTSMPVMEMVEVIYSAGITTAPEQPE